MVIPVYNEEEILEQVFSRLEKSLDSLDYELIFVNDGSTDGSGELIEKYCRENPRVRLLELSRNFGQYYAVSAGLDRARGEAVVVLDADLQDPPELIPQMIEKWKQGFQVVVGIRKSRPGRGLRNLGLRFFNRLFVWLADWSAPVSGGFALMDRQVVEQLIRLTERHRYLPGLRSWVGFRQTEIYYEREERIGGKSKWSFFQLVSYGLDAILSFSHKPLRLTWFLGLGISSVCFIYGLVLTVLRILGIGVVRGFTTIAVSLFFLGGVQLIAIGLLGEYLARVYDEVKQRPLYIVAREYPPPEESG